MNNDLVNFRHLAVGATFYLDAYYGNAYRKVSNTKAEFVRHRLNNQYVGHVLEFGTDRAVRLQPIEPETLDLLGIHPHDNPFAPYFRANPDYDLLGDSPKPPNPLDLL
jgi:hypothetical protein